MTQLKVAWEGVPIKDYLNQTSRGVGYLWEMSWMLIDMRDPAYCGGSGCIEISTRTHSCAGTWEWVNQQGSFIISAPASCFMFPPPWLHPSDRPWPGSHISPFLPSSFWSDYFITAKKRRRNTPGSGFSVSHCNCLLLLENTNLFPTVAAPFYRTTSDTQDSSFSSWHLGFSLSPFIAILMDIKQYFMWFTCSLVGVVSNIFICLIARCFVVF